VCEGWLIQSRINMPKSKSRATSSQAQVQGEVVSGHIELNGQGSIPSHKSVKPGKFVNYVPGSYKKALMRSMAQRSSSNSGEESSKTTASKQKKSPKPRLDLETPPPATNDSAGKEVADNAGSNTPLPASGERALGEVPSGSSSVVSSVANSPTPPSKPEVEAAVLAEAVLRLADLVVPRDGDAKARVKAELKIRRQLAAAVHEKVQASRQEQDGPPQDLPAGVELVAPGSIPNSAQDLKRAKEMLAGVSSSEERVRAWRAECTMAASHLVRLLGISEKRATDLYCSSGAVDGRGARSVITAIRSYLKEQASPDRDAAIANLRKCTGSAMVETEEFLAQHHRVRVDGFGFRHLPWTGEIFALASETLTPEGTVHRTWALVGLWGVVQDERGLVLNDWTFAPEARFVIHRPVNEEDNWEYAALFGDLALPRLTVHERRLEVQRQFEAAARRVDNQTPEPSSEETCHACAVGTHCDRRCWSSTGFVAGASCGHRTKLCKPLPLDRCQETPLRQPGNRTGFLIWMKPESSSALWTENC